jgi:hypothetical protein
MPLTPVRHPYVWAAAWVIIVLFVAFDGGMPLWMWIGAVFVFVGFVANGLFADRLPRFPRDDHDDLTC